MPACTLQMTTLCAKNNTCHVPSFRPPAVKVKDDYTSWPAGSVYHSPDSNAL